MASGIRSEECQPDAVTVSEGVDGLPPSGDPGRLLRISTKKAAATPKSRGWPPPVTSEGGSTSAKQHDPTNLLAIDAVHPI